MIFPNLVGKWWLAVKSLVRPWSRRWRAIRRVLRRRVAPAVAVVLCLCLLAAGWIVFTGWRAQGQLTAAAALARDLERQLLAGETEQAKQTLAALQDWTDAARRATGGPLWRAAEHLPQGGNLAAVREIAIAADELARRVLPALAALDPAMLTPTDGRFPLTDLRAAVPELAAADAAATQVRDRFAAVPTGGLAGPVRDAVHEVRTGLGRLATLADATHRVAALLPPLLGAEGRRTYLLAFQNLAELRATGGMLGAYVVVQAVAGRIEIIDQGSAPDLKIYDEPVLPLSREMRGLYRDLPGIFPADVNLTPHFPTAALLYREMYRRQSGRTVDGVLATDPVALARLLRVIGPVPVPGFPTLTATTAVSALLSEAYLTMGHAEQDRFFAASAMAVFRALWERPMDPRSLASAIRDVVAERRLLFWSARDDEQAQLEDTPLAGVLPEREEIPTVGVFLNDGSGAKLGYYLSNRAELTVGGCRQDGRRELRLRVTISSRAPRSGLPRSVLGLELADDPYAARTLVYVFSPAGGTVRNFRVDGAETPIGSGVERRRRVGVVGVDVPPGGSRQIEVSLLTQVTTTGDARLWLTPGVTPWTTHISSAPKCDQ